MGKCCLLSVFVLALSLAVGTLLSLLQQPVHAEAIVRALAEVGGISQDVWKHVEVVDDSVWHDIVAQQNLGIAEGYMFGKLKLDLLPFWFEMLNGTALGTRRQDGGFLKHFVRLAMLGKQIQWFFSNPQSMDAAAQAISKTYDVNQDLYEAALGPSMGYTCGYWKAADNLDQAQFDKYDLVFRKMETRPGMKVLDLGMGWGVAMNHMRERGQLDVTGVSLSEQQVNWAKKRFPSSGLRFLFTDYRDHCEVPEEHGTYDRIYSMGMLEHVGYKNYGHYFECVKKLLKPDGLAVIHTIGEPDFVEAGDPFIHKYIFPAGFVPPLSILMPVVENLFIVEDLHNFGYDYAKTLASWYNNSEVFFKSNPMAYTPEFQRMWQYYLKMCEAHFELRIYQLWQFVLSPRPATRKRIQRQL